jgi:hypothetical protein
MVDLVASKQNWFEENLAGFNLIQNILKSGADPSLTPEVNVFQSLEDFVSEERLFPDNTQGKLILYKLLKREIRELKFIIRIKSEFVFIFKDAIFLAKGSYKTISKGYSFRMINQHPLLDIEDVHKKLFQFCQNLV